MSSGWVLQARCCVCGWKRRHSGCGPALYCVATIRARLDSVLPALSCPQRRCCPAAGRDALAMAALRACAAFPHPVMDMNDPGHDQEGDAPAGSGTCHRPVSGRAGVASPTVMKKYEVPALMAGERSVPGGAGRHPVTAGLAAAAVTLRLSAGAASRGGTATAAGHGRAGRGRLRSSSADGERRSLDARERHSSSKLPRALAEHGRRTRSSRT